MKKCVLLFVILVAVLTLTLVAFSCESERVGQTAEAITIYNGWGVVQPNYLSYYDLSSATLVLDELTALSSGVGCYYFSSGSVSILDSIFTIGTGTVYFVVNITDPGYYYLTVMASLINSSYVSSSMRCFVYNSDGSLKYYKDTVILNSFDAWGSYKSGADCYFNTGLYCFAYRCNYSGGTRLRYCKLERYSSAQSSQPYAFSGFVIPGVTFNPDDYIVQSPYDEWNGIVHPNLLTQTDFYRYPFYHSGSYNIPTNVYYSDLPTTCFSPNTDGDNFYGLEVHVNPDPDMGDVMPPTATIKYRYINNEPLLEYFNSIFTLRGTCWGSSGSIVLTDDLGHTASTTLSLDNHSFLQSVLFEYQDYDYLDIEINFVGVPGQILSTYLEYGKLELGDLFTGFVPDERSAVGPVNYNLLPNYDFADVPFVNAPIENNADNWVIQHVAPNGEDNLTVSRNSAGDLLLDLDFVDSLFDVNTVSMVYEYVPADTLPDNNFTFSLCGFSYCGIEISCYSLPYTSEALPYAKFYFTQTFSTSTMSVVFPAYSSGVRIELRMTVSDVAVPFGDTSFRYAKLEYGTRFTGFVGESDFAYNDGYDQGYTAGYSDGIDQFASSTYKLVFDNTGSNLSLATGWADMGLSSAAEILNIVWSITPAYYEELGIPVISSGYFYLRDNDEINGVRVYCSKYEINEELYDEYFNIYWVDIYEHSSTLVARDDTFPETWLSDALYRTVSVNVARYNTDIYNKIYDNAYQKGWYAGEDEGTAKGREYGYNNGKAVGYQDGLKTAQNGSWTGLVSALIDVPVTTIVSFLDFDILGFNMLSALKTIILLSLFFFVIRFVTAKVL